MGQFMADHTSVAGSVGMHPHSPDGIVVGAAKGPSRRSVSTPGIVHDNDDLVLTEVFSAGVSTEPDLGDVLSVDLFEGITDGLGIKGQVGIGVTGWISAHYIAPENNEVGGLIRFAVRPGI